jgi:hypothetical protein
MVVFDGLPLTALLDRDGAHDCHAAHLARSRRRRRGIGT